MPSDGKACTFDCIYCECGLNAERRPRLGRPSRELTRVALEERLRQMAARNELPDVLTFAGNGEPTAHPDFAGIIDDTLELRDRLCPGAGVSVLSNATMAHRDAVRQALMRVDNNILKLDAVDPEYVRLVNRPTVSYDVEGIIETIRSFMGHAIVQTMFMRGTFLGRSVDNTTEAHVGPWLAALARMRPGRAMVYTIDRETPAKGLEKAPRDVLDGIAARVRDLGIDCTASY